MESKHAQNIPIAVLYVILAAFCLASMSVIAKFIGEGASTDLLIFARFSIWLFFILPWVAKNPHHILEIKGHGKVVIRSFFTLLAMGCFLYAVRKISLTNALLLTNTFPLFVPIVTAVLVKTKTSWRIWSALVLGFLGVAFILKPTASFIGVASLIGLGSGVFTAVAIVLIRLMTKTNSILQILFYNYLIGALLSACFLPLGWVTPTRDIWILLAALGIIGGTSQFLTTLAFAKAPVRITSPLMFLSVIFGSIADFLFWNTTPDLWSLIGVICVIVGGSLTIYFGQKEFNTQIKS